MKSFYFLFVLIIITASCKRDSKEIINVNQGKLKSSYGLTYSDQKEFLLDSSTAPRPKYLQVYTNNHKTFLSILNNLKNDIYIYDYDNLDYLKSLRFEDKTSVGVQKLMCYYILNDDSIYVFDAAQQNFILTSDKKNLKSSLSLIDGKNPQDSRWTLTYPQHNQTAASPILNTGLGLLFPGQYIWAIPDDILKTFKYTAKINFQNNDVSYIHHYPPDLYDSDFGWDDPVFTAVYADLSPDKNHIIYSFPISHDLYIGDVSGGSLKKVYGGSNFARSIQEIPGNVKHAPDPNSELRRYISFTDLYAAIKYDKYRNVYYRVLERRLPDETANRSLKNRILAVIILDENLSYLGETNIGVLHNWNWENSFVTKEGLNIEYLPPQNDESKLIFKIFTLKPL